MPSVRSGNSVVDLLNQIQGNLIDRREVLRRGIALGLTAPVIATLLAACGGDDDDDDDDDSAAATETTEATEAATEETEESAETEEATEESTEASAEETESEATEAAAEETSEETEEETEEAASDDVTRTPKLRIIQFQAPTILNPHLSTGYKDYDASRLAYEPLAEFNTDGEGVPILGTEFPSLDNGGLTEDGLQVTWKLRENAVWHDGTPFTSADVKFTWEWVMHPESLAVTTGSFAAIEDIETPDDYTVVIKFAEPNPAGFLVFTGRNGMVIPKHIFQDYMGAEGADAPQNLAPVGTGPYKVTDFKPGDVALFDRHTEYWDAPKPYFDSVELKGGGDSVSAARAVVQTGDYDFAWSASGAPEVIKEIEDNAEAGVFTRTPAVGGDRLCIQLADPKTEVDGAFAEPSTKHPIFQHLGARQAIALALPRDDIASEIYGNGAVAESNNLAAPKRFYSPNTSWTYDLEQAQAALDESGVEPGTLVLQTSLSETRQKCQQVIKQELDKLGFNVELKTVDPAVFFSSDAGNPDTYTKFYADLEIFTYVPDSVYPILYMTRYLSTAACQKANGWANLNVTRYQNPEYDELHAQASKEMDPDKQNELFIKMNDISVNDVAEIPMVTPVGLGAHNKNLTGHNSSSWAGAYWDIADWKMEEA